MRDDNTTSAPVKNLGREYLLTVLEWDADEPERRGWLAFCPRLSAAIRVLLRDAGVVARRTRLLRENQRLPGLQMIG